MRITTTYFGPAELKNLYITTNRDRQRMYRTVIHPGKLQLTNTYSIMAYCGYSPRAHRHSAVQSTSTITQIAIILILLNCVFETSRFIVLYQLTITFKHFKYELSS